MNFKTFLSNAKFLFVVFCTVILLAGSTNMLQVLAQGSDQGGKDQGGKDQGGADQGGSDQGGTDQGGKDQGGKDQGGSDQGGTDQGGTDQGGKDQGGNDQPAAPQQAPQQPAAPVCPDIAAPTGLSVNVAGGTISWNNPGGAISYKWRVDDMNSGGLTCNANGDGCSEDYRSNSMTWSFTPGHRYHVWVHAVSTRCEGPAAETYFDVAAPATPVPQGSSAVTVCGKTGVLAPGYTLYTPATCSAGQYLYVNVEGGYLTNACLAVPAGNQKTADGCSYAPVQQAAPTPTTVPGATATPVPTRTPTPTSVPGATVTPTPTQAAQGTVQNCPTGQVLTMQNSQMVCVNVSVINNNSATATSTVTVNNPAPAQQAAARSGAVKVAGVSTVNELPKTGLPIAAWALSGLLPLGVGLKRFGAGTSAKKESPKYLWQKREYLKDLH